MQLNNAPRILPEVSEEQVSDLLIDGRIRQVLQRNNIDPDLDMFVANHFAVSLVVHNEYDITIEGIKTDLKQLVPGAISNCEYLHFNGKLHTRATWGFSFVDTQPAFGAVESKLSIGLPWHAKPDSNIILAIRAVNSSFPIRKKLLDVEPTKPHILSKKEVNKSLILKSIGSWSVQSTGLIDVDEYTRSYSDVSPIICEENHISRPFYTRNNFPYKSPSDLQRDITNSKLSTDDPSAELIRAIELQQHHTTSSLYGSIEQLQRIATIIRIGQTLETDDEIYKLHAHDIL